MEEFLILLLLVKIIRISDIFSHTSKCRHSIVLISHFKNSFKFQQIVFKIPGKSNDQITSLGLIKNNYFNQLKVKNNKLLHKIQKIMIFLIN